MTNQIWDIMILSEILNDDMKLIGYIVSAPNGETAYLTVEEYKNRKEVK